MAFCSKCGAQVADNSGVCPSCGQSQGSSPATAGSQSGLDENVAGTLCYAGIWVTGLIFFLIDKRPYVRFHAAQSIVVFGGLHVINIIIGIMFGAGFMMMGGWGSFGLGAALYCLVSLLGLILWILLMVKAYQGEKFQVPVAAGIAQSFAGK